MVRSSASVGTTGFCPASSVGASAAAWPMCPAFIRGSVITLIGSPIWSLAITSNSRKYYKMEKKALIVVTCQYFISDILFIAGYILVDVYFVLFFFLFFF